MDHDLERLVEELRREEQILIMGGGPKAIVRQHEKGRLIARERIARLLDVHTHFFELGLWAAWKMYQDWGGAPSAGVVTGIGSVAGRRVMVIANGAAVHAAVSGTIDFREPDDVACTARLRRLIAALPHDRSCVSSTHAPGRPPGDLYSLFLREYDIRDLLPCILDEGPFDEYKAEF